MRELWWQGLESLRNKKTAGLERVCNKHLKCVVVLTSYWIALFSNYLRTSLLPTQGRNATLLMIFKRKGNLITPRSWRGIEKKKALLAKKPSRYLGSVHATPTGQHGFRRECYIAMADVEKPRNTLYAVFVNFLLDAQVASVADFSLTPCGSHGFGTDCKTLQKGVDEVF